MLEWELIKKDTSCDLDLSKKIQARVGTYQKRYKL